MEPFDSTTGVQNISMLNYTECLLREQLLNAPIFSNETVFVLVVLILSVIILFVVAGNVLVLMALALTRLRRVSGLDGEGVITVLLMGAIAFDDLILGVANLLLEMIELLMNRFWSRGFTFDMFRACLNVIWSTVSMYNMTSLAVDRYMAVCHPFFYRSLSGRRKLVILVVYIALPFVMSIFSAVSNFKLHDDNKQAMCGHLTMLQDSPLFLITSIICLYIPMAIMLVLYYKIFRKLKSCFLRRFKNSIKPLGNTLNQNTVFNSSQSSIFKVNSSENNYPNNANNLIILDFKSEGTVIENKTISYKSIFFYCNAFRKSNKAVMQRAARKTCNEESTKNLNDENSRRGRFRAERTLALLLVCFLVCWLPLIVLSTVSYFTKTTPAMWLVMLISYLAYSNAALSPVLFCLHREIRQAVKILLHLT